MRVHFNTFDTHADEDNIIDIESIAFGERLNIRLSLVNPKVLVGELGEIGQLSFNGFDFTFNKNVIISSICIFLWEELGESIVKYNYFFSILP